ncbi:UNVERIFIED_CONTAM: hypothetical protein DES50_10578 [Williamsia faeni]
MADTAGLDDLVNAYIQKRQPPGGEEVYWAQLADSLGPLLTFAPVDRPLKLFRVDPDRSKDSFRDEMLDRFIEDALNALSPTPNPFSGFLEAPDWVIELSQTSGREINDAQEALQAAVAGMIRKVLVMRWPGIETRTVSWATLKAEGIDRDPPDPPDWDEWY